MRYDRRQVLRAAGICMALPLFETFGAQELIKRKKRAVFIFAPNGVWIPDWKSQGAQQGFNLPPSLTGLNSFKNDISTLSNLGHEKARANGDGPGDHARSSGTFLTATQIKKTAAKDISAGISFDQILANQLARETSFKSLEYSMEAGGSAGECDSGYSCAYVNNISWANAHLPLPRESRPREAFERLFGDPEAHLNALHRAQVKMRQGSVLDLVLSESGDLMRRLSKSDNSKMQEYQDSVRALEKRLTDNEKSELNQEIDVPDFSSGKPMDYRRKVRLFYDVMTLAMQTDKTRVCSLMLGRGGSNIRHASLGVKEGHHSLSHHKNDAEKIAQIKLIDRFHIDQFAYFLERLREVKEGGFSLLDNSMLLFGSCIHDGNRHNHHDLPLILAGHGAGALRGGQHLTHQKETPLANLFLGMSEAMGQPLARMGDSNGKIDLHP